LYNLNDCMTKTSPNPLKSFMNLTTPCTNLKFNSTNEILAVSSSYTENACKLVNRRRRLFFVLFIFFAIFFLFFQIHLGSMSVFSNFPLQTNLNNSNSLLTAMRIPQCIDFSANSGYFTIGNHKGNALLYR
jgi:U3 small nucleolar RNA-associated protein 18